MTTPVVHHPPSPLGETDTVDIPITDGIPITGKTRATESQVPDLNDRDRYTRACPGISTTGDGIVSVGSRLTPGPSNLSPPLCEDPHLDASEARIKASLDFSKALKELQQVRPENPEEAKQLGQQLLALTMGFSACLLADLETAVRNPDQLNPDLIQSGIYNVFDRAIVRVQQGVKRGEPWPPELSRDLKAARLGTLGAAAAMTGRPVKSNRLLEQELQLFVPNLSLKDLWSDGFKRVKSNGERTRFDAFPGVHATPVGTYRDETIQNIVVKLKAVEPAVRLRALDILIRAAATEAVLQPERPKGRQFDVTSVTQHIIEAMGGSMPPRELAARKHLVDGYHRQIIGDLYGATNSFNAASENSRQRLQEELAAFVKNPTPQLQLNDPGLPSVYYQATAAIGRNKLMIAQQYNKRLKDLEDRKAYQEKLTEKEHAAMVFAGGAVVVGGVIVAAASGPAAPAALLAYGKAVSVAAGTGAVALSAVDMMFQADEMIAEDKGFDIDRNLQMARIGAYSGAGTGSVANGAIAGASKFGLSAAWQHRTISSGAIFSSTLLADWMKGNDVAMSAAAGIIPTVFLSFASVTDPRVLFTLMAGGNTVNYINQSRSIEQDLQDDKQVNQNRYP